MQHNASAGSETPLEEIFIEPIELKSMQAQTDGEPWAEAHLTYTPKESELLSKLQQLEKMARNSKSSKDKFQTQKEELALKLREFKDKNEALEDSKAGLVHENDELKNFVEELKSKVAEKENQLELMKNAGYNKEQ